MTYSLHAASATGFFRYACLCFIMAKVLSTATLLLMGDYRAGTISSTRRTIGIVSKITPSLAAWALAGWEFAQGNLTSALLLLAFGAVVAWFAFYVMKLRRNGRFYGVADRMLRVMTPVQVKLFWLAILASVLLLTFRSYW